MSVSPILCPLSVAADPSAAGQVEAVSDDDVRDLTREAVLGDLIVGTGAVTFVDRVPLPLDHCHPRNNLRRPK